LSGSSGLADHSIGIPPAIEPNVSIAAFDLVRECSQRKRKHRAFQKWS
jgi:hypothetical protein